MRHQSFYEAIPKSPALDSIKDNKTDTNQIRKQKESSVSKPKEPINISSNQQQSIANESRPVSFFQKLFEITHSTPVADTSDSFKLKIQFADRRFLIKFKTIGTLHYLIEKLQQQHPKLQNEFSIDNIVCYESNQKLDLKKNLLENKLQQYSKIHIIPLSQEQVKPFVCICYVRSLICH